MGGGGGGRQERRVIGWDLGADAVWRGEVVEVEWEVWLVPWWWRRGVEDVWKMKVSWEKLVVVWRLGVVTRLAATAADSLVGCCSFLCRLLLRQRCTRKEASV